MWRTKERWIALNGGGIDDDYDVDDGDGGIGGYRLTALRRSCGLVLLMRQSRIIDGR